MPRIDTFTARGREAVPNSSPVSPRSFGGQLDQGLTEFGRQLEVVSDKLQQQKDDLDLVDRASHFEQKMAEQYQAVLKDDTLLGDTVQDTVRLRANALKKWARAHLDGLSETQTREVMGDDGTARSVEIPPASKAVCYAMEKHSIQHATTAELNMRADVLKNEANRQAMDLAALSNQAADFAAREPWNEPKHLDLMQSTFARARETGVIPREVIDKQETAAFDRFYRQMASVSPQRMLRIQADILSGGEPPRMMDQSKVMEYGNLAQARLNAKDKEEQAAIKESQEKNHATMTAMAIRGELDRSTLATWVEQRGIDPDKAASLVNLNEKIKETQKAEHFVDGRTAQIETRLLAMKYDPKTTKAKVEAFRQLIFDERMKDHIPQRDFEHLNSLWQGVNEHINQEDKTGKSSAVSHAHEVLMKSLTVTGPMAFDALANQTQTDALLFFYRELERDPNANPMDVMERAQRIFKPVIEQRIKLGETDQSKLDDAKMDALVQRKGISQAAHEEWKKQKEVQKGNKIVKDTLDALPPPTEPSWFDAIMEKVDQALSTEPKKPDAPKADSQKQKMRK